MFNTIVNRIDNFSRALMEKICVHMGGLDDTAFMTETVLLYERVENLKLANTLSKFEPDKIDTNPEVYSFHWFEGVNSNPDELLKPIKNKFKTIEKLPTHEKFLSDQLKQPIFIRLMPEEKAVCIFTTKLTYPVWHCTQFFIPKFFPIFKEKPLTKEEVSFLETLTHKTSTNYVSRLTELVNKESFKRYALGFQLDSFEKRMFGKKVEAAERSLTSLETQMQKAMDEYKAACQKRVDAMALVMGLKAMAAQKEEHSELQDYLLNNNRICNLDVNDSNITFIAKTYLTPHHIDEYDVISKNATAFKQYETKDFSAEDIKLVMDSIFSSKRCMKLKLCAFFKMDYFGSEVTSIKDYAYVARDPDLANYIPNPHLQHHNCFGQNRTAIVEQLKDGDTIGAIECSIACAQRIYIHDVSYREFIRDLIHFTGKCLVAKDGSELTPKEAVAYLKGQNNE